MPKQSFIWEEGKNTQLELFWEWQWKNFTLIFDGQRIGTIADENELRRGRTFTLASGSSLKVQLFNRFLFPLLVVFKDGRPLAEVPAERNLRQLGVVYVTVLLFVAGGARLVQSLITIIGQRVTAEQESPPLPDNLRLLAKEEQEELNQIYREALQALSPEEHERFQALEHKGPAASSEEAAELSALRQKGFLSLPEAKQERMQILFAKAMVLAAQKQLPTVREQLQKGE